MWPKTVRDMFTLLQDFIANHSLPLKGSGNNGIGLVCSRDPGKSAPNLWIQSDGHQQSYDEKMCSQLSFRAGRPTFCSSLPLDAEDHSLINEQFRKRFKTVLISPVYYTAQ